MNESPLNPAAEAQAECYKLGAEKNLLLLEREGDLAVIAALRETLACAMSERDALRKQIALAPTPSAVNQAAGETDKFHVGRLRVIAAHAKTPQDAEAILSAVAQLAKLSAERDAKELEVKGALAQLSQHVSWLKVSEAECKALQQQVESLTKERDMAIDAERRAQLQMIEDQAALKNMARRAENAEKDDRLDAWMQVGSKLISISHQKGFEECAAKETGLEVALAVVDHLETALATATRQNEEMAKERDEALKSRNVMNEWHKEEVDKVVTLERDLKVSFAVNHALSLRINTAESKLTAALAMVETMRGDKERLDWLSGECYLPGDHPDDGLLVVVSEKFAPIGAFTCNPENDAKAFRAAIDLARSKQIEFPALSQVPPTAKGEDQK